jgi:hypothetical protein
MSKRTDFIRKGTTGDWVNHLTPAQAALIEREFDKTARKINSIRSARGTMILERSPSSLRGTLAVNITPSDVSRLLCVSQDRSTTGPWGIRTTLCGQPLGLGSAVRLEVSLGGEGRLNIERAEVVSIANAAMDLRIAIIGAVDGQKLRDYCSVADERVVVYAPALSY